MIDKLNPDDDNIKTVFTDQDGKIDSIEFKDGNTLRFVDFLNIFKLHMRTIVAGEIVSWDDVFRFSRQTDAQGMEEYLDNVEQEGILKGSRFQLTRSQKMSLGAMIIILMIVMLTFLIMASVLT